MIHNLAFGVGYTFNNWLLIIEQGV
jgi:hypothetical protein